VANLENEFSRLAESERTKQKKENLRPLQRNQKKTWQIFSTRKKTQSFFGENSRPFEKTQT
jgi:hypothetical protein